MKHNIGPIHYSTREYQTQAKYMPISNPTPALLSMGQSVRSIHDYEKEQIELNQKRQTAMNQYAQDQLDSFAMQKIAEEDRRLKEDQIREERNRRAYEEWDRMDATQREMDFDDQFRMLEEEQKIGNILNREAKRDRDIDSRIERSINGPIDQYMHDMDAYNRQMRRNEEDIANQAFAQMREENRSNRPGSTKPAISQLEKDAISMLENMGYTKQEATSRVASVYQEGMSAQDLFRAALKG